MLGPNSRGLAMKAAKWPLMPGGRRGPGTLADWRSLHMRRPRTATRRERNRLTVINDIRLVLKGLAGLDCRY